MPQNKKCKEHTVRSVHAKVTQSGRGLWGYVNRDERLYNYWRYQFKKFSLPYPKRIPRRLPASKLLYYRLWHRKNKQRKKIYMLLSDMIAKIIDTQPHTQTIPPQ